jgi:hypothetical protein
MTIRGFSNQQTIQNNITNEARRNEPQTIQRETPGPEYIYESTIEPGSYQPAVAIPPIIEEAPTPPTSPTPETPPQRPRNENTHRNRNDRIHSDEEQREEVMNALIYSRQFQVDLMKDFFSASTFNRRI